MSGPIIVRAGADDWRRVRDVRLRALADAPDAFGSTLEREKDRDEDAWRGWAGTTEGAVFLAVDGEMPVGLAAALPWRGEPGACGFFAMWVAPGGRRRGVGRALVAAVVAFARDDHRFDRVLLEVGDHNDPAIALYAACGFEPDGHTGLCDSERPHLVEHRRVRNLRGGEPETGR